MLSSIIITLDQRADRHHRGIEGLPLALVAPDVWMDGVALDWRGPMIATSTTGSLNACSRMRESALSRYFTAFEAGRLPETRFANRVQALESRQTELRARLGGLQDSARAVEVPGRGAIRDAEEAVRDAMLNGTPGQGKALLKELVVEVRVESRDSIIPTFRLPTTPVRVTEAVVGRSLYNANRDLMIRGSQIAL